VAHLAAIGLRKGLDVLGPLPPWLQKDSRNFKVSDGSDLHLALSEISGLIWMVQALLLNSWRCHSQLPLSPALPAGLWLYNYIVKPSEGQHMSQMHYFCLLDGTVRPKAKE
jgi:hypothetical protein